eukprot:gene8360-9935_t
MKCRVEGNKGSYSAGLLFCGKKLSTVMVTDCIVANCVFGIKVDFHQVNVTITNTTIVDCSGYGMVVGDGVMGNVTVNDCTFTRAVLANASGEKCTLLVDGVRRAPSTVPMGKCNCGRCGLSMRRATKTAGLGTVNCAKCNTIEPAEWPAAEPIGLDDCAQQGTMIFPERHKRKDSSFDKGVRANHWFVATC